MPGTVDVREQSAQIGRDCHRLPSTREEISAWNVKRYIRATQ